MDDKKFEVYQLIRTIVFSRMEQAKYNEKDARELLHFIKEDVEEAIEEGHFSPSKKIKKIARHGASARIVPGHGQR